MESIFEKSTSIPQIDMTILSLFIHKDSGNELENFVDTVFTLFSIELIEERESLNYPPNNRYFVGYGKSKHIKLWDDDSETLENYPFVLTLYENTYKSGNIKLPDAIVEIAEKLGQAGIKCFLPFNDDYWESDWDKTGQIFP